jgi:kynureninase
VRSVREANQRAGVVVLDVPNGKEVTQELTRREVLVDYRPQAGIRIAPHFYTSDEELDHAIAEMRRIVELVTSAT